MALHVRIIYVYYTKHKNNKAILDTGKCKVLRLKREKIYEILRCVSPFFKVILKSLSWRKVVMRGVSSDFEN